MPKKNLISIRNVLSANVTRLRKSANLSQSELAKRTGLTHNFINDIENGKKGCSLETIERLANTFDVSPYQLFLNPSQWFNAEKQEIIGMIEIINKNINVIFKDTIEKYKEDGKSGK